MNENLFNNFHIFYLDFNVEDPINVHDDTVSPTRTSSDTVDQQTPEKPLSTPHTVSTEHSIILNTQLSPPVSRKRSAFTIDNIMGRDTTSGPLECPPENKRTKFDIFDSIPSPPPKISDMHNPAMMGMPGFPPHLYNPFLLNLAAARGTVATFPSSSPRSTLGLLPIMSPFLHPGLAGALPGSQSVL